MAINKKLKTEGAYPPEAGAEGSILHNPENLPTHNFHCHNNNTKTPMHTAKIFLPQFLALATIATMLYITPMAQTPYTLPPTPTYPEWQLQAYVSTQLFRLGILHHADQNAAKRGPKAASQAKAMGLCAGWPDMVVVLAGGRTVYIEYKTASGTVSAVQRALHKRMTALGLEVHTIHARHPQEAWVKTQAVLGLHGGKPE